MENGKPSQTAQLVAIMRARHFLSAPEPKILRDNMAFALAGMESPEEVATYMDGTIAAFTALSDRETATKFVQRIEESVCLRARLLEHELIKASQESAAQFVILGAGLDSTAYRLTGPLSNMRIFEVDHPDSQAWKKDRLGQLGIEIPKNLTFVPFDFENSTLSGALEQGGVSALESTVFSWLGVHMYLSDEAVKNTLAVMGKFPKGSLMVMDFIMPQEDYAERQIDDPVSDLAIIVGNMSEPFKSLYNVDELNKRFMEAGFTSAEFPEFGDVLKSVVGDYKNSSSPENAKYLAIARK